MSRYDDKWLDICVLLRELQSNGIIEVIPRKNDGKLKRLDFKLLDERVSDDTAKLLLQVFTLADKFEFLVSDNKLSITIFVNVFS